MTDKQLSPQAQAIVDAYESTTDKYKALASVLLAAADEVVPDEPHPEEFQFWDDEANDEWQNNQYFRKQLLAIVNELEQF